jgi:hypothetical protein
MMISIQSRDFDGDSAITSQITADDVIDGVSVEIQIDGASSVEGRWYLHCEWGRVHIVDLDAVIARGHYYGGASIDFNEGSAHEALQARRAALDAE